MNTSPKNADSIKSLTKDYSSEDKASERSSTRTVYRSAPKEVCQDLIAVLSCLPEGSVIYSTDAAMEVACIAYKGDCMSDLPQAVLDALPQAELKRKDAKLKSLTPIKLSGAQFDRYVAILEEEGVDWRQDTRKYWKANAILKEEERLERRRRRGQAGLGEPAEDPHALSDSDSDSDGGDLAGKPRARGRRARRRVAFVDNRPTARARTQPPAQNPAQQPPAQQNAVLVPGTPPQPRRWWQLW